MTAVATSPTTSDINNERPAPPRHLPVAPIACFLIFGACALLANAAGNDAAKNVGSSVRAQGKTAASNASVSIPEDAQNTGSHARSNARKARVDADQFQHVVPSIASAASRGAR